MRKRSVLFLGSPYWCRYLAELLEHHSAARCYTVKSAWRWLLTRDKQIVLVGLGVPDTWKRRVYFFVTFALHALRFTHRPAIFWIGSDVLRLRTGVSSVKRYTNVAGSPWLADEVAALGYTCHASLFPVTLTHLRTTALPDSDRLQVLSYVADAYPDTHGGRQILAAAVAHPDVDFTVIGGTGSWCKEPPGNLRFVGWVKDMQKVLDQTHVVWRNTPHDSLSAFVREGLITQRHVFFSHPFEGAVHVPFDDKLTLRLELERLQAELRSGTLALAPVPEAVSSKLQDVEGQAVDLVNALTGNHA